VDKEQHIIDSVLSRIVSTVNKSHATIPSACARRNCVQLGPVRRGAGPRPWRRSSVLMVVAPTRMPSLRSSPQIRTQPQRAFCLAIRRDPRRARMITTTLAAVLVGAAAIAVLR
jgi:hypothetical protein